MDTWGILPGRLWQASSPLDWSRATEFGVDVIVDVDGDGDHRLLPVPWFPSESILYAFWPLADARLPDTGMVGLMSGFVADLVTAGRRVLVVCSAGVNRSGCCARSSFVWPSESAATTRRRGCVRGDRVRYRTRCSLSTSRNYLSQPHLMRTGERRPSIRRDRSPRADPATSAVANGEDEGSNMTKAVMVVLTNPAEGREDEYNEWYARVHFPEVTALPGFVGASRYRLADAQLMAGSDSPPHRYLALDEIEADDLPDVVTTLTEQASGFQMTDALDASSASVTVFERLT